MAGWVTLLPSVKLIKESPAAAQLDPAGHAIRALHLAAALVPASHSAGAPLPAAIVARREVWMYPGKEVVPASMPLPC